MGRIAYLSKRGNIWWFRRRHPAIVIPSPQNPQHSGLCLDLTRKAQAKGHLAISLQTSSSREARLLGTRLSDHFERAWALFEVGAYRMTEQDDPLDMMAQMLTEGFRKFITHYRASGMSGMAPGVRERAFARLDAELREALGIEALPYADMLTRVEIKPGIKYIVLHDPDPNAPMTPEDEFHERMAAEAEAEDAATRGFAAGEYSVAQAMDPSDIRLIDPDDEDSVNRLETMADGFGLEEICQLRVRDFAKENGIIFVAVQNELGSQLVKSANSIRRVPLHKALIDIGLPKLVELRQQEGMSRLFPDMPRSKSKGTMSAIMSKRFGYYIRSRGIKDDGLDFHALRTEFLVRLTRAKVPDHVRKGLMGHEQTDVTHANYFRAGETMDALKEYVDRIDIDHKGITPPFGAYLSPERLPLRLVR